MKNEKVTYGKSFEMLGYWEKIGVEGDLDEGETIETALNNYKERLDKWHKENNPDLYGGKVIEEKKNKLSGSIGKDIETVTELTVLKSYELIVKNNPELKSIYEKQFKKLSK